LEVAEFDAYRQLTGPAVTSSPAFKENMLSFGVCYGLAIQALGKGRLNTNLVPPEIVKDRQIRAKKPWAVAAVATLLLGCTIGYLGKWREWNSAREDDAYKQAFGLADGAKKAASDADSAYKASKEKFDGYCKDGQTIAGIGEVLALSPGTFVANSTPWQRDKEYESSVSITSCLCSLIVFASELRRFGPCIFKLPSCTQSFSPALRACSTSLPRSRSNPRPTGRRSSMRARSNSGAVVSW
jgi:hypothetical protein